MPNAASATIASVRTAESPSPTPSTTVARPTIVTVNVMARPVTIPSGRRRPPVAPALSSAGSTGNTQGLSAVPAPARKAKRTRREMANGLYAPAMRADHSGWSVGMPLTVELRFVARGGAARASRPRRRRSLPAAMTDRLYFTDSDEANELIARDPMALLIGFALDQQERVQKAFHGPLVLRERLGSLDAAAVAAADLDPLFRERPAIHRYPGVMAERVRALAEHVRDVYDGDAARGWTEAADSDDLLRRLHALPRLGGS